MSTRDEYNQILARAISFEEQRVALSKVEYHIHLDKQAVVRRLIVEEKLLQVTDWEPAGLTLYAVRDIRDKEVDPLRKLTWDGWHSSFELEDGVSLDFNDASFSIEFDDDKRERMIPFVQQYQLQVIQ